MVKKCKNQVKRNRIAENMVCTRKNANTLEALHPFYLWYRVEGSDV